MTIIANKLIIAFALLAGFFYGIIIYDTNPQDLWQSIGVALGCYALLAVFFRMRVSPNAIVIRQGLLWQTIPLSKIICLGYSVEFYKGYPYHFLEIFYKNNRDENIKVTVRLHWYTAKSLRKFFPLIFRELPNTPITGPLSKYLKDYLSINSLNPVGTLPPAKKAWDDILERYHLRPNFTELDLFLMTFLFILLLIFDPEVFQILFYINKLAIYSTLSIPFFVFEFLALVGLLISIVQCFSPDVHGKYTKKTMYAFGIMLIIFVGILSAAYIFSESLSSPLPTSTRRLYAGFALQNLLYGTILFITFRFRAAKDAIKTSKVDLFELIVSLLIVSAFFIYGTVWQNYPWPLIFSGGIFYVTMVNPFIHKIYVLFNIKPKIINLATPTFNRLMESFLEKLWKYSLGIFTCLLILSLIVGLSIYR